ncbi:MAG: RNA polymerase sigma-70 factor [Pyrinomonadaceae bacterium]
MESTGDNEKLAIFDRHRSRLFGLAYRMLGTPDEAEEIVQDAYIRWHTTDLATVENPEAWLVSTTTRLSIDRLRKASRQRETYIGPWLPEPLMISNTPSPHEDVELASSLSTAFLLMLERLSPAERAVFLLHDVFDSSYSDIARIMEREEPAVRQMLHRARQRVRTDKPRFEADRDEHRRLVERFSKAAYTADETALLQLFSPDISVVTDGGGKVTAARKVVQGLQKVMRIFTIAIPPAAGGLTWKLVEINGEPGVIEYYNGEPFAANTFATENGRISTLYRIMNPEKLRLLKETV